MLIKKKVNRGYVFLQSIIVLSLILVLSTTLVKLASIKLQDSLYYSKNNNGIEFTVEEDLMINEIREKINNNEKKKLEFIKKYNDKEKILFAHNTNISIIYSNDKTFLKERKMNTRKLKEIIINIDDNIHITPGVYETNYEVDYD